MINSFLVTKLKLHHARLKAEPNHRLMIIISIPTKLRFTGKSPEYDAMLMTCTK